MYAISSNFFSSNDLSERLTISIELIVLENTFVFSFTISDINSLDSFELTTIIDFLSRILDM